MNNLDSLQVSGNQLPPRATGSPAPATEAAGSGNSTGQTPTVSTPGGNNLPPQASPVQQNSETSTENIEQAVERLADFAQSIQRALSFSVDDITGQTVLTVKDGLSDKVIRQIPSEEVVELARKLQELQESSERLQGDATGNLIQVRV